MALKLLTGTPFANRKAIIKGLVAGSLIVSSILMNVGIFWRLVLFIAGILVLLEAMFPYGKELYVGSVVATTIVGGILSLAFYLSGALVAYTILIIIVIALLYLISYSQSRSKTWF